MRNPTVFLTTALLALTGVSIEKAGVQTAMEYLAECHRAPAQKRAAA